MPKLANPDDIVGQKFGELTVLECVGIKLGSDSQSGRTHYRCACSCGKEKTVGRGLLLAGRVKSCGHLSVRGDDLDAIIGKKYGKLTVEERIPEKRNGRWYYRCRCECGKETEVERSNLIRGLVSTCGNCVHIEREGEHYRYYCHSQGSFIFDEEDYDLVASERWNISHFGYVTRKIGNKTVWLTHALLGVDDGVIVDHINGDRLDNRRANLREATPSQNLRNQCLRSDNKTGYKGVYFNNHHKKYLAEIRSHGVKTYIGLFDNPVDAALAYDEAARVIHGEFACVNFPQPGERGCREAVNE